MLPCSSSLVPGLLSARFAIDFPDAICKVDLSVCHSCPRLLSRNVNMLQVLNTVGDRNLTLP